MNNSDDVRSDNKNNKGAKDSSEYDLSALSENTEQEYDLQGHDLGLNEDVIPTQRDQTEPELGGAEDGSMLEDAGLALVQGANQLAQGGFDIWKNAGGYLNKAISSPLKGVEALARATGKNDTADFFDKINIFSDNADWFDRGEAEELAMNQIFKENNQFYESAKSEEFKQRKALLEEEVEQADGEVSKAWATMKGMLTDPALTVDFLAKQVPMLTGIGAVGRAGALMGGAKAGVAAAVGTGATMQGGSVATETYEAVLEQSPELWAMNDQYIEMMNRGMNEQEAKQRIATELKDQTFLGATAVSVLVNMLPGARALEKSLVGVKLNPGAGGSITRALTGAVGEGLSEAIEEGSGVAATNLAVQQINPEQSLTEGVGRAAGEGAMAFIPGAAGGVARRSSEDTTEDVDSGTNVEQKADTEGKDDTAQVEDIKQEAPKNLGGEERSFARETDDSTSEYNGEEKRSDVDRREKISKMSNEDIEQELYGNDLTGLKNRRAFDEDVKHSKEVVSVDLDGLASANDYGSMDAGDSLLKAAASAFDEVFGKSSYHISGDEFYILDPGADLDSKMGQVREKLSKVKIETTKDGKKVVIEGGDFSYGKGETKDKADASMKKSKVVREKEGNRTPRKELPPNMKYFDADGNQLPAHLNKASELEFTQPTSENENESGNSTEVLEGDGKNPRVKQDAKRVSTRSEDGRRVSRSVDEERDENQRVKEVATRAKSQRSKREESKSRKQKVLLKALADANPDRATFEKKARAAIGPGPFNNLKTLGDIDQIHGSRSDKPVSKKQKEIEDAFTPKVEEKTESKKPARHAKLKTLHPKAAKSATDFDKNIDSLKGGHYEDNEVMSAVRANLEILSEYQEKQNVNSAQSLFDSWAKKYSTRRIIATTHEDLTRASENKIDFSKSLMYVANVGAVVLDGKTLASLSERMGDNFFAAAIEALAHEFGHSIHYSEYKNAPRAVRKALFKDFAKFFDADKTVDEAMKSYPPALAMAVLEGNYMNRDPDPRDKLYVSKFQEWLANRISNYIVNETMDPGNSLVTNNWIKNTVRKMRAFYTDLFASGKYSKESSPKSVDSFMKHVAKRIKAEAATTGKSNQKIKGSNVTLDGDDPIFQIESVHKGDSIESMVKRGANKKRNPKLAELNRKRMADYNIPVSEDGYIKLGHYSNVPDLTSVNPSHHGEGIKGAESARKTEDGWVDRSYFGLAGYKKERGLGPHTYTSALNVDNIYDVGNDHDNLWAKAYSWDKYAKMYKENTNAFEKAVKDAGYDGIFNPRTKMMMTFDPIPVQPWTDMGNQVPSEKLPPSFDPGAATFEFWTDGIALDDAYTIADSEVFKNQRSMKVIFQESAKDLMKSAKVKYELKKPSSTPGLVGEERKADQLRVNRAKAKFSKDQNKFIEYAKGLIIKDVNTALKTNPNAIGWYDRTVAEAMEVLSTIHPEIKTDPNADFAFKYVLAVTSNGLRVDKNFQLANTAYSYYKENGKMDEKAGIGTAGPAINKGMEIFNNIVEKEGVDNFRTWMNSESKVKDLKDAGHNVGGESNSSIMPNSVILGPKIGGGFFSNLNGRFDQLTMDRWLVRSWGRWSGTLIESRSDKLKESATSLRKAIDSIDDVGRAKLDEILSTKIPKKLTAPAMAKLSLAIAKSSMKPANRTIMNSVNPEFRKSGNNLARYVDGQKEAPKNAGERDIMRTAFNSALDDMKNTHPDMTMADMQALLWYAEKRLYDSARSDSNIESYADDEAPDYANAAVKLAKQQGINEKVIKDAQQRSRSETDGLSAGARSGVSTKSKSKKPNKTGDNGGVGEFQTLGITESLAEEVDVYGDKAGKHLDGLNPSVVKDGRAHKFTALKSAQTAAKNYAKSAGLPFIPVTDYQPVNEERAKNIAQAFEDMAHDPSDPRTKAAYRAMIDETYAQYQSMLDQGVVIEFMPGGKDVYGNPRNAIIDVVENNHMYVFSTKDGFGTDTIRAYRGQHGDSNGIQTRLPSISFGDKEAATIYANDPNDTKDRAAIKPRVIEADLVITNPIINNPDDPFIDLSVISDSLGKDVAIDIANRFSNWIEETNNWEEIRETLDPSTTVKEFIASNPDRIGEFYIQAFPVLDDQAFIDKMREKGYDGAIYGGAGGNALTPEYRVLSEDQIKKVEPGSPLPFSPEDNPLLEASPFEFNGEPALANDIFRAVHDYFGHVRNGVGFRAGGEENAWRSHASMYTPLARLAATTETRGQNSWVNYGPHGEANRTASGENTVFADQKIGILPDWAMEDDTATFFSEIDMRDVPGDLSNVPITSDGIFRGSKSDPSKRSLVERTNNARRKFKRYMKRNMSTEGLLNIRKIVPEGFFESIDTPFQNKIKADGGKAAGEKEIEILNQSLRNAMHKAYGRKIKTSDYEMANRYLAGEKGLDIPVPVKSEIDAMRSYLDILSDDIMDTVRDKIDVYVSKMSDSALAEYELAMATQGKEGNIPVEIERQLGMLYTISENKGMYLNRSYAAFDDSKWNEHVQNNRPELIENAKKFISKEQPDLTDSEVTGIVEAILLDASETSDMTGFISRGKTYGSKDNSILKHKKEIPLPIRELLGEHKDIRVNFAKSATKMNYLVINHKFLMNLYNSLRGVAFFNKADSVGVDKKFIKQITKGDTMSPINGMYTTEDFHQGLEDAMETLQSGEIAKMVMATNSMVKYGKTIISPATQIANFLSGIWFTMANGHLLQTTGGGKAYQVAMADLAGENSFGRFMTPKGWSANAYNGYIRDLIRKGVLHDNPNATEMRKAIEDFMEFKTHTGGALHPKKILEVMQKTYQLGDDFWKIIGYESEKASKLKAGVDLETAERIAASRVRDGYPTYSMVPRLVQQIRRWYLVGTFVSFPYEMGRTTANQFKFLKEDFKMDKPAFARRIMGLAISHSFFMTASYLSYSRLGMDEDDDEAVRALLPPWSRNSTLLYTGFDKDGLPTFVDLTRYNPYAYVQKPILAMINGNNETAKDKLMDAIKEVSEPFIGPEISASALVEVYTNKRIGQFGTISNEADTTWQQNKDKFNHLRRNMQPTILTQLENVYKATQGEATGSRQRVVSDELLAIAGYRAMTMNVTNSIRYKGYDFTGKRNGATQILSRVARNPGKVSDKELTSAYERMNDARTRAYGEMIRNVDIARKLGMSDEDLRKLLRGINISLSDTNSILKGEVPAWKMSSRFMKKSSDLAVLTAAGSDRKKEVMDQSRHRKRIIQSLIKEDSSE